MIRPLHVAIFALALFARGAYGQDEDEDYGGEGEDYGGEEDAPPPPPAGPGRELETLADFESFLDDKDASVIAAFTAKEMLDPAAKKPDDWDDDEDGEWAAPVIENPALTAFNEMAQNLYDYRFAVTYSQELLEKLKATKAGGLFLYRSPKFVSKEHGDKPRERFPSDKWTESAVSNWLKAKSQPLVGLYSSSTKERYSLPTLVIFLTLDFETNAKGINYVLKRARKAAAAYKGKLAVGLAPLADFQYQLDDFGVSSKSKADILMAIAKPNGDKFAPPSGLEAFSGKSATEFADKFLAGQVPVFEKPEPPPMPDMPDSPEEDYGDEGGEDKEEM